MNFPRPFAAVLGALAIALMPRFAYSACDSGTHDDGSMRAHGMENCVPDAKPKAKLNAFSAESVVPEQTLPPTVVPPRGVPDGGQGSYNPSVQPTQPCVENPGQQCYSREQLQAIHNDLTSRYDDLDGMVDKVFKSPKVVNDPNISRSDVGGLSQYLDAEEKARDFLKSVHQDLHENAQAGQGRMGLMAARMNDIAQNRKGGEGGWMKELPPDKKNELRQIQAELTAAMKKLVPTDFHEAVMDTGDRMAAKAMGGSTMPGHDWPDQQPKNPAAWLYSAQNSLQNGDTDGAMQDLNKTIDMDPQNAAALSLRSQVNMLDHDFPAAASDAKKALAINPNDEKAQQVYALTHGRSGVGEAGVSAGAGGDAGDAGSGAMGGGAGGAGFSSLSMTGPGAAQSASSTREGMGAMKLGDYNSAISHFSNAISANPYNAQAYNLRSIAYNKSRQFDLALSDALAGLKVAPKSVALLLSKAMALNKLKRFKEAEAAARQALELDPNNAQAYDALAQALAGQGTRNTEVIAALRHAAEIDHRYDAKLQAALQMPAASDLTFLFPDDDAVAGAKKPAAGASERDRNFKMIAGASVIGGGLLALGLISMFMPQIKEALTKLTRTGPAVSADALPAADPRMLTAVTPREGLLRGQYQIGKQIGIGGMGLVFEGQDLHLKRRVAVKKMRDEIRLERRERERFVTEAKVVAGLHHPGIVEVFAILEENDDVFLVFEYISGKTLHDIVQTGGPMSLGKALPIVKAAGEALDYAHTHNIIHRDLKPSNIMLTEEGRAKVMDFGIARIAKDAMSHYSMTNTVVGTPPYMAPEQEQGVVRRESDTYALAICLYEMLTGKMPFNGSGSGMLMNKINKSYVPASKAVENLPSGVDEVMARALEPDPEKRFHSAAELVAAFEALAVPQKG